MFFFLLSFYFENLLIYNVPSNFCNIKLSITTLYRNNSSLYQIRSKMSWIGNKLYRNIQLGPLNVQESIHIVQNYSYLQGSSLGQSSRIFANQKGHLLSIFLLNCVSSFQIWIPNQHTSVLLRHSLPKKLKKMGIHNFHLVSTWYTY